MKRTTAAAALGVAALLTLTACGGAAGGPSEGASAGGKLVVWNWSGGGEADVPWQAAIQKSFKDANPGVDLEVVTQPFDQYYTLLGSAIEAGTGPDIAMFNGGTQMKRRVDSLTPMTDELADLQDRLVGWEAFQVGDDVYGAPMTLQGMPIYYNKALFKAAGLDPNTPPSTWDELEAACTSILKNTDASCFAMGNKEGLGIEFFLSGLGSGIFTPAEYQDWVDGKRDWESDHARQVLQLWADTSAAGWYNEGANSTAMFNGQFDLFSGGTAAITIGLFGQWKTFSEFLGEDLGFMMPVTVNPGTEPALPRQGGIAYALLNPDKKELGGAWAHATVDPDTARVYVEMGGGVASDSSVERRRDVPAANEVIAAIPDGRPNLHTALSGETLDLLHRLGQLLLIGDVTVDDAVAQLAASEG